MRCKSLNSFRLIKALYAASDTHVLTFLKAPERALQSYVDQGFLQCTCSLIIKANLATQLASFEHIDLLCRTHWEIRNVRANEVRMKCGNVPVQSR